MQTSAYDESHDPRATLVGTSVGVVAGVGTTGNAGEVVGVAVPTGVPCDGQVSSITSSAFRSDIVTVSDQRSFTAIHDDAYSHQYSWRGGFHVSGAREPFERFADAETAIRCSAWERSFA